MVREIIELKAADNHACFEAFRSYHTLFDVWDQHGNLVLEMIFEFCKLLSEFEHVPHR